MKYSIVFPLLVLFLCMGEALRAQELKVVSFQRLNNDLQARVNQRVDLNGDPCAIVKVSVANAKDYKFSGNIIGETEYKMGEADIFMSQGTRFLTISSEKFGSMKYEFPDRLEKQVVYKLSLRLIQSEANKVRTLIMPQVGLGSTPSVGVMLGVVKKVGGYVKVMTNLKSVSGIAASDSEGKIEGHPAWYTGETKISRLSITGGLLVRLALPVYMYMGAGYGYQKNGWKTVEDQWVENEKGTSKGVEADAGFIFRVKNVSFSLGVVSNSFKYADANLGIGFMF